ncbi:MAG: serine/threonine-protein kinase, partial [Myxococcota bacterium]|nr:serine/threonine-protein kinase [Myxococcota bacterium]
MSSPTSQADFASLPPGRLLAGRYRVREQLGEGAYAAVYLADDEKLARPVALKVLDPLRGADPVGRSRFEREYQVLSRLSHPHIARCHALAHDGTLDILVMEHVEGETLADRLVSGRLRYDEAVAIAIDLADALHACHDAGVLHRDLKPANIQLTPTGEVKILDFGISRGEYETRESETTGHLGGTVGYIAPERLEGVEH